MNNSAPFPQTIAELLESNAARWGSRVALESEDHAPLGHDALWHRVNRMSGELRVLGIGRGDRIALMLPQGSHLALTFLAVACGATAAPLHPGMGAPELLRTLEDLEPRALVLPAGGFPEARSTAAKAGVPVVDLHPGSGMGTPPEFRGDARPRAMPGGAPEPGDIALVLNTSGTTARPKRVPLSHSNLLASLRAVGTTLGLGPDDRGLSIMPLFHIHGLVACLLAPLGAGGSTVCTPAFDPDRFLDQLSRWCPTWYSAVPTMHQAILARASRLAPLPVPSTLRVIRSSSSALPPTVMSGLESAFGVPVVESYGMTEASHQMASNPLPPRIRKPGSVGPAAGPEIAILNEAGGEVPQGTRGEVVIRGPGVTRGYENLPAGAPEPFVRGWFRTGDQGYVDADGYLFLTGRLKELINRGGEKIAPREVDEALLRYPGIREAVAFAVPHPTLGEDLAAAVVPAADVTLEEAAIREFALAELPFFKVPSRILIVNELPKGPSGKVQRIGLAGAFAAALIVTHEAPASPAEQRVAEVFAQVLGRDRIGRLDNFFSLGGDSLRATQAANRLQQGLGFNVPLDTLFRFPTPALLAGALERLREADLDALASALEALPEAERERLLKEFPQDSA